MVPKTPHFGDGGLALARATNEAAIRVGSSMRKTSGDPANLTDRRAAVCESVHTEHLRSSGRLKSTAMLQLAGYWL